MKASRMVWAGAIAAVAIVAGGERASAQHASGQYYGYASPQGPAPSGQAGHGCFAEKIGCQVIPCPNPPACQNACWEVQAQLPPIQVPSCQNACVIVSESAPPPPITITVYRNHYVPIKVVQAPPPNVQPVNIEVKWREIHYLCDERGNPIPTPQGGPSPQGGGSPQASALAAPAVPVAAQENNPPKSWVWLEKQRVYGFGFRRADGLWVIDPTSKRPTLPEGAATTAQPTAAPATATVATTTGS